MTPGPARRIRIQWTRTARDCLKKLPPKVQRGLVSKADELKGAADPKFTHKPLTGPLSGYYRITYARYRAIYRVDEEKTADGDVIVTIVITFVACGIRAEHSKNDVYNVVQKLVDFGFLEGPPGDPKPKRRKP